MLDLRGVTPGRAASSLPASGPSGEGSERTERTTSMQWQTERVQQLGPDSGERALRAMVGLWRYVDQSGLEEPLLHLVMMRASQINGCAYCLDMHSKDARARGESEQRLYLLDAWRESPFYSERERAALLWTEAVTLIADDRVPDAVHEEVRKSF